MLKDALTELHQSQDVEIVEKVKQTLMLDSVSDFLKLVAVLDIGILRDVGGKINEIVRILVFLLASLT